MEIFGYFKFKEGLNLCSDCLNKEYDIEISKYKGKLLTPLLIENFKTDKDNIREELLPPKSKFNVLDKKLNWGMPYSWPEGDSNVSRLLIELNIKEFNFSSKSKLKLEGEIENWINRFRINLFAYDYNIDTPALMEKKSTNDIFEFFELTGNDNVHKKYFEGTIPLVTINISDAIKECDLRNVINATSLNKKLVFEYQLLKDANNELMLENYRKSILDSATALEVSLTNAIIRDLEINETLLFHFLKKYNGLKQKRELLKLTKNTLPKLDYEKGIDKPRNEAIHSGKVPTKTEARNAYIIAKKAIDYLITGKFE